ncbi:MAG: Ig-like domain-containing protein [Psychroserpens sp.]|uniref:Ig-like domain-containing protein n=1 Tax=Psychroserpens sp. TaxID=2020870 RepID=UPI0030019D03
MNNIRLIKFKRAFVLGLVLTLTLGCERDLTDDAVPATFARIGDVFIDTPVGLGSDFYFPFAGSKLDAATFDGEGYESSASIRIDVPNANDPNGNYAGAIFRVDGAGRDLSGFDALTFWAKASQGVNLGEVGFGVDFIEDKFQVTASGLSIGTNWTKYVIPIPDASKLLEERGMFWYSAGTQETGGSGYVLWFDDIKFENLGTVAQPRPAIFDGNDLNEITFIGSQRDISGLSQTFNLASGIDQTVAAAPSYFEFSSSNTSVASVNESGQISIVGSGTTTITATLDGLDASGSITLESLGEFTQAPIPDRAPENVISVFSDAYTNVPVDYYNGFFAPFQTTLGGAPPINIGGGEVINYTDLNFVGIGTFLDVAPVNAAQMTHFHVDINVQEALSPGDFIRIELLNGVQTTNETSGSVTLNYSQLVSNGWASFDIALGDFNGLSVRDALGLIILVTDATISNVYVDNIYYYKEVVDPSPNVDDSAATQVALPIGFESTTLAYDFAGFEGADSAIEANPDPSGINPTANVMRSTKTVGAQFFGGTFLNLDAPIDFSTSQKFRMKVWSPKVGIPIRVRLENVDNSVGIELDATTTTSGEWEELEWDFSGMNTSASFVKIVVFFEFIPGLPGDGSIYYFDDIQIID